MTPAITQSVAAPPDDPVRQALEDADLRAGLLNHALCILGRWFSDRPATVRFEAATEAVQETQLRAWAKRQDFEPTLAVRPWLHGIMNDVLSDESVPDPLMGCSTSGAARCRAQPRSPHPNLSISL